MSKTIDSRVVEMRFDNKQFQAATKETLGTLQRLKEALKLTDSKKSLEGLDKSIRDIRLDGIASSVSALEKRFSTMGIIGMQVIKNITNALQNTLAKGIHSVTDSIVSGGIKRAMNLENAHFQLQQILDTEQQVQEVMNAANASVDGTAYSFDVAAKAASQFIASGVKDMDQLSGALRGLAGVTATYNADYEQMALIFTQVAGKGRVMGDELLQLSSRGLNAAATITTYFNGINDGSIQASDNVTAMVKNLTKGLQITEGDLRDFVSKGRVNFEMFAEAMSYTFGDSAKKANDTFNGALSNIKSALARIGAGFVSPLVEQNSKIVELFNAVRVKINEVKKALVFDKELGNIHALSKQVTDTILNLAAGLTKFVNGLNITKPMKLFYQWVEIIKNSAKGLWSVLKPVGQAFKETFLNFKIDTLINISQKLVEVTKGLKLSKESSENLKDAFNGIMAPAKLLIDIFANIVKAIFNIDSPAKGIVDTFLSFAGSLGRATSSLVDWVTQSGFMQTAAYAIGTALKSVASVVSKVISSMIEFSKSIDFLPTAQKMFERSVELLYKLGETAAPYIKLAASNIKDLAIEAAKMIPPAFEKGLEKITDLFKSLKDALSKLTFKSPTKEIKDFNYQVDDTMIKMDGVNSGFSTLLSLVGKFDSGKLIDFSEANKKIDDFKDKVLAFSKWLSETLKKTFSDASISELISGGVGISIIYAFSKAAKAITDTLSAFREIVGPLKDIGKAIGDVAKSIANLPKQFEKLFEGINGALKAYQRDLNASAIIKIAGAIAILAASIGLLSLLDTDKVMEASKALSLIAGVLLVGVTILKKVTAQGVSTADALTKFADGITSALNKISKGFQIKSIGSAVKNLGVALALVAGSIIALAVMYNKDSNSFNVALSVVESIAAIGIGIMVIMSTFGQALNKGMGAFKKAASGVTALSLALFTSVAALNKLFKMTLPADADEKLDILGRIYRSLALVAIAVGVAGRISGENSSGTGPIIALTLMLIASVGSLKTLFNMDLPSDWMIKSGIMVGIFMALAGVMVAIGYAAKLAGGAIKATSTILAMCVFIGTIVAALIVLTVMPGEKILIGAVALGGILLTLGAALYGAGKVADPNAINAVYAMAVMTGAIVVALSVLSMIDGEKLLKSVGALGAVLLTLAVDLYSASKIDTKNAAIGVLAMIAASAAIAYELYKLSEQPWEGMLAAAGSMSLTLLAFASALSIISTMRVDLNTFAVVLAGVVALIPIAIALYKLSEQPWDNMLAAGASISAVMLSMSAALAICSAVGAAVPAAMAGILAFDVFLANFIAILGILGTISETYSGFAGTMSAGGNILIQIGEAIGGFVGSIIKGFSNQVLQILPILGDSLSKFSKNVQSFISGMKQIDGTAVDGTLNLVKMVLAITAAQFLQGITSFVTGGNTLSKFGSQLLVFGPQLLAFSLIVKNVDQAAVLGAAAAGTMLVQLANDLPKTGGLVSFFTGSQSLAKFGAGLVAYGVEIVAFAKIVEDVNPSAVTGASTIGQMMINLQNTLPKTGGLVDMFSGKQSLSDFGKGLVEFGKAMSDYAASVAGINTSQLNGVANELRNLINVSSMLDSLDTSSMSKFAKGLKDMANNALNEFITAFQNGGEKVSKVIKDTISGWEKVITTEEGDLKKQSEKSTKNIFDAIAKVMDQEASKGQSSMKKHGKLYVDGLSDGITKNLSIAVAAGKRLAKALDDGYKNTVQEHSPPAVAIAHGILYDQGVAKGVEAGKQDVFNAGKLIGDSLTSGFNAELDLNEVYSVYGGFSDNLIDQMTQTNQKIDAVNNKSQKSLKARVSAQHQSNASMRTATKEAIQIEKDYWSQLLEVKKAGADAEQYQSMSVEDFRKSILEGAKEALQNYTDTLESTRDSIMGQMDLFSEVEEKETKTKEELVDNLNDQIDAYQRYVETLSELNERLGDSKLGEYLRQLGVDSLGELQAINSMTDDELSSYAALYDEKLALATDAASIQLTGLRQETETKLAELFGGMTSAVNLADFQSVFDGSFASITKYVNDIMIPLQNAQVEAETASKAISQAIASGIADESVLSGAGDSLESQLDALISHVKETSGETAGEAGKEIGGNVNTGIADGLTSDTSSLTAKSNELMNLLEKALKDAGEIHSPSARSNREIGLPWLQGIIEGMTSNTSLLDAGVTTVMSYLTGQFTSHLDDVKGVSVNIMQTMQGAIQNEGGNFETKGSETVESYLQGVKNRKDVTISTTQTWVNTIIDILKTRLPDYNQKGIESIEQYLSGITGLFQKAFDTGSNLLSEVIKGIDALKDKMYSAGANATMGFVDGMRSKIREAASAAAEIARAAYEAAMSELDINSPSRKMFGVGDNAGIGFVNGLLKNVLNAARAGKKLSEASEEAVNEASSEFSKILTDSDFLGEPVIRPTVDLTNVKNAADDIVSLFNNAIRNTNLEAMSTSGVMNMRKQKSQEPNIKNGVDNEKEPARFSFTQYNYSPKALSRTEIYRQTKNQFTALKGVVNK